MVRRWLLLVTAMALGVVVAIAAPAHAHNQLVSSDPEDGASMAQGPDEVTLTFLQTLDPGNAELSVTGPEGDSALAGDPAFDGSSVTIPVGTGQAGEYELYFDVLSADGHWVDGTVAFTVTEGEPVPTPSPEPAEPTEPVTPPAASPQPAAQTGDGSGSGLAWWVWLLIAAGFAAAAGGASWLARRRRQRAA